MPNLSDLDDRNDSSVLDQMALNIAGVELNFYNQGLLLKAFPGQAVPMMMDHGNPFDVPDVDYIYQLLTSDLETNNLGVGEKFVQVIKGQEYFFELGSILPDLTGWSRITANYLARSLENV